MLPPNSSTIQRGPMKGLVDPGVLPRAAVPERWQPRVNSNEGRRAPPAPFAPPTTNTPTLGGLQAQGFRVPNMRDTGRPQSINYGQLFQGLPQTTRDMLALNHGVHSGNVNQLGAQFGHLFAPPAGGGQPQNLQQLYAAALERYPFRTPQPRPDTAPQTGGPMPSAAPQGLPPSHVRPNPYFPPPGTGGAMPRPMSPGGGRPAPLLSDTGTPRLPSRRPDFLANALERFRQPQ